MTLHTLLNDIRYYILQATVPAICLLPDITLHCLKGVYYPELEHKLMLAATEDPLPRKLPPNLSALRYDQSVAKARFSQSQNSEASSRRKSKVMRFSANLGI
jgi:hypothetical protein